MALLVCDEGGSAATVLSEPVLGPDPAQPSNNGPNAAAVRLWVAWDYVERVSELVVGAEHAYLFLNALTALPHLCVATS